MKRPLHREGAGDVGREIVDLAGSVDENQVPVLDLAIVLDVMEDAGVGTGGHDRGIAVAARPAFPPDVFHGSLNLILVEAGTSEADGLPVPFG